MENRRSFIKKTSVAGFGYLALSDPFINALASVLQINPSEYAKMFSHICDYTREEDLLNLRFYFVNLELKNGFLSKSKKSDKSINAYMIVRIPQQHIIDQFKTTTELNDLADKMSKAFISGYSYLTF